MLLHLVIAIIGGAAAGFGLSKVFDRVDMGTVWTLVVGALGGIFMSTYLGAFGLDERDPLIWSIIFALLGGALSVFVIGLCRPGLKVFWEVLTGKSDGVVERR